MDPLKIRVKECKNLKLKRCTRLLREVRYDEDFKTAQLDLRLINGFEKALHCTV